MANWPAPTRRQWPPITSPTDRLTSHDPGHLCHDGRERMEAAATDIQELLTSTTLLADQAPRFQRTASATCERVLMHRSAAQFPRPAPSGPLIHPNPDVAV